MGAKCCTDCCTDVSKDNEIVFPKHKRSFIRSIVVSQVDTKEAEIQTSELFESRNLSFISKAGSDVHIRVKGDSH